MLRLQFKAMLECLFDHRGIIVRQEFIQHKVVSKMLCRGIVTTTRVYSKKKIQIMPWQMDHSSSQCTRSQCAFCERFSGQLDHPTYLPNKAHVILFPKLTTALKEQRFPNTTNIQQNMGRLLNSIPEFSNENVVIDTKTEYFKSDSSH